MSSRYIVRHPDRPHTYAMFHDEHGWVWTAKAADATSYLMRMHACMAAMEVEVTHGIDCRGCVIERTAALQGEYLRRHERQPAAVDLPEVSIDWTPEMLADEDRWARRRIGGAS